MMYPHLQNLIGLEIDTLQTISEIGDFQNFAGLYQQGLAHRSIRKQAASLDLHADFILDVRLRGDKRTSICKRWVHIGALIEGDRASNEVTRASYSFVLFRGDNVNTPVVRKLHFDFEPISERNHVEPKPSSHIQMCGKASQHLIDQGFKPERLSHHYPSFEKPRVPALPISFALLIDWLFIEFQSDRYSKAIYQNSKWRNQVIEAEKVVLKPYFEGAAKYIGSAAHATNPLIRSMLYGL